MAYSDIKDRIVTHAATAADTVTPSIDDVQQGFPLPKGECVRVWYGGETEPRRMGGRYTLDSEMVGQVTMIGLFLPITTMDEEIARLQDARGQAFADALRTAIDADTSLAGEGDNTTLEYCTPDLVIVGNTRYIVYLWSAITDYVEYTIAR